jgi:transposase
MNVLSQLQASGALPPGRTIQHARALREELDPQVPLPVHDSIAVLNLSVKLALIVGRAAASTFPALLRERALQAIALDPFAYFELECKDAGISRDADAYLPGYSFFFVSKLSARNLPLPRIQPKPRSTLQGYPAWTSHPCLATNLTDAQWAVLAPLIPPDPRVDWLSGQPPVIIAANRWGFSRYHPGSEFNDFVILQEHDRILQRFPGLAAPPLPAPQLRRPGRPRKQPPSPRALLDAIFWKLATGHTWKDLPAGFPPARLCRDHYRRLFLSGRLYTLLLALYNHLRLEAGIAIRSLVEAGVFTTTPGQKIALSPGVPPTWENYTALLFMQLARKTYSRLQREWVRESPWHLPLPDFKGDSLLSTGALAAVRPAGVPPPKIAAKRLPPDSSVSFAPSRLGLSLRSRLPAPQASGVEGPVLSEAEGLAPNSRSAPSPQHS